MKLAAAVLAIISIVALFSCNRDYTCECKTHSHGPTHPGGVNYEKLGRIPSDDATNTCRKIQINRVYDTCTLTSVK